MASPHVDGETGWFVALVTGLLGSTGFWSWWTARAKARARADPDLVRATAEGAVKLVEGAGELNDDYRQQLKFVRAEIREIREVAAELKTKVEECDARHEDCERSLTKVRAEIERLMKANPPADY